MNGTLFEPRSPLYRPAHRRVWRRPATWGLVVLPSMLGACTDDGTSATTSTTDSSTTEVIASSTTTTDAPSADAEGSSSTRGLGTTAEPTTSTDGGGSTTGGAAEGTTTGLGAFDVPFTVLDRYALPLSSRVQPGWTVITSAAEWDAVTGVPVPTGVSFPEQWLVYGSRGPQPFAGHDLVATSLTWDRGRLVVDGRAGSPGGDCETFQFTWPADTLLVIDALRVEVDGVDDQTVPETISCAMAAGEGASCDLVDLCGPGLLCAGLVRSTVLSNSPGGLCLPQEHAGVFSGGSVAIPGDGTPVEASLPVAGLTSVDMDVVVWVELDHPDPSELVIELRNPDGNQVSVASNPASPLHPGGVGIVPLGFSGDESVNGTWWLVVTDTVINGVDGGVMSWELEIMSRYD
ncbi:MAG: proprotein convertase P-domain-containing protein [Myxococcota bacterium]